MRVCPSCSRENPDDVDFCQECNTYLRWDPTMLSTAVPADASKSPPESAPPPGAPERPAGQIAQRLPVIKEGQTQTSSTAVPAAPPVQTRRIPAAQAQEQELVQITLRLPGDDGAGSAFAKNEVDPGGSAVVRALVRNQSGIVDNYDISIEGMPEEWSTITPSTVYLVPFGAPGGQYEQEVEIRLHPPRSAEAEARAWLLRVVATSKAHEREAGSASITSTITPYQEFETEMRPEYARGRWRGNFAIAVRNRANAPCEFTFSALDASNACRFEFADPVVTAKPGRRAGSTFRARPRKQIWIGKPIDRRFQVSTTAEGSDKPVTSRPGVYHQKPWIPKWLPLAIPILAAAAAAVILLLPHSVKVPNLKGKKVFAAQKILESQGLAMGAPTPGDKTAKSKLIGRIEDQSKQPGTKVKKGTAISVTVWQGTDLVEVPDVTHMTLNEARLRLDKVKLQIVTQTPPTNPNTDKIISQSPPPGGRPVAVGSPVQLFFPAVTAQGTTTGAGGASGASGAGGASGASGASGATSTTGTTKPANGSVAVPKLAVGSALGAATTALAALGLSVQRIDAISPSKTGSVVGLDPPSGTSVAPGTPIRVFVSRGFPKLVFDDGLDVKVMDGATGKHVANLAATSDFEDEPSWQPRGNLVAYRRSNASSSTIWTVNAAKGVTTAQAVTQGPNDHRPVFAPDGKSLAFIRFDASNKGSLCFLALKPSATPSCVTAVSSVDRPAWSPDGKAILTVDPTKGSLFLFTTKKPFSTNAAAWTAQGTVGPAKGNVLFVAFSPDDKQVAVAANWGASDPSVYTLFLAPWTTSGLGAPKPFASSVRACDVAWRSDGLEIAVTVMTDCGAKKGDIVGIDPTHPTAAPTNLGRAIGTDPAWQPIQLSTH